MEYGLEVAPMLTAMEQSMGRFFIKNIANVRICT